MSTSPCHCGCKKPTKHTYAAGHNRRAQGQLLTQLAHGDPDKDQLATYTATLRNRQNHVGFDPTPGRCLCGCGNTTRTIYASGHGCRHGDALLLAVAGHQITFTDADLVTVLATWRTRQVYSPKAARRNERYESQTPQPSGHPARDSSTSRNKPARLRATRS